MESELLARLIWAARFRYERVEIYVFEMFLVCHGSKIDVDNFFLPKIKERSDVYLYVEWIIKLDEVAFFVLTYSRESKLR